MRSVDDLSVSGEKMCTILVNGLEDKACPVKVWLGKLSMLDMTPLGWLGHKTYTNNLGGVVGCHVSYVTGASNWYCLTVGQGLISLYQVRVEGECLYFFCFFTFIPVPLSTLFLSFISSTISSVSFLPFSGRRHKMAHKGWHVVKPQLNQSTI